MCFELCGPPIDGTAEDLADYDAWLESLESELPEPVQSESDELVQDEEDEDEVEVLTEHESYERYDDMLNECYPSVNICGYDYDAARAFKEVDPIAYQTEYSNWLDHELQEGSFTMAE